MQEDTAAEAEERRRAADEGTQQYLQFLAGALKRIAGEDVSEDLTPAELQSKVEHEFQRWEDSLDAQRRAQDERQQAQDARDAELDQKEAFSSAAAATDYILNLMKTSKKFRDDTDMVSSIALLQNIIKTNKKGFDSQYGKYIEQIRRNREAGRSGNLTVASEYDRKENELGYV